MGTGVSGSFGISVNIQDFDIGRMYNGKLCLVSNAGLKYVYVSIFRDYPVFDDGESDEGDQFGGKEEVLVRNSLITDLVSIIEQFQNSS
jgi:hypothetical protein